MQMARYERDMIGYGPRRPAADWPGGAKIAVQFVLNYEEGGESCLLHGDAASEGFLSDIPGAAPWPGERNWNMESLYEYGARAGFWRLHRLFTGAGVPLTIYGVAGQDFGHYLIDSFDTLYAEGVAGLPAMMSVGLHCRLIGRPGKIAGLQRFLDHIAAHEDVWCPTRLEIARHWAETHPPVRQERPSAMTRDRFVERFGGVFAAWTADRAFALELGPAHDTPAGLHNALARMFRSASHEDRLSVLAAQPDPAEMLVPALSDNDLAHLAAYKDKHGFPFILAASDHEKAGLLDTLARRMENDTDTEFAEACHQVERIARLRLEELL